MNLVQKIQLSLIPGIGPVTARKLLETVTDHPKIPFFSIDDFLQFEGISHRMATTLYNGFRNPKLESRAAQEESFIKRYKITPLFIADADYPRRLRMCADAPSLLYFKGAADLNHGRILSVVGTRHATEYGKRLCKELVEALAAYDVCIISGLAYGIDICAHRAAIENGMTTVGVLGHGLDRIYPSMHRASAEKMISNGGLLTEFLSGTTPDRENFPMRNRIIAGISDGVVVVEAGLPGGAIVTATQATSYNREIFSYPGRVTDTYSKGCHHLIATNQAQLVTGYMDIVKSLSWNPVGSAPPQPSLVPFVGTEKEQTVLSMLAEMLKNQSAVSINELLAASGFSVGEMSELLLSLEIKDAIQQRPGRLYMLA